MFQNNVVVTVGDQSTTYSLIENQGRMTDRRVTSGSLTEPEDLIISHEERGKSGSSTVGRHLVKITSVVASTGSDGIIRRGTINAYVVFAFPTNGTVSDTQVYQVWARLRNFLAGTEAEGEPTNVLRVIRGEP